MLSPAADPSPSSLIIGFDDLAEEDEAEASASFSLAMHRPVVKMVLPTSVFAPKICVESRQSSERFTGQIAAYYSPDGHEGASRDAP